MDKKKLPLLHTGYKLLIPYPHYLIRNLSHLVQQATRVRNIIGRWNGLVIS